MLLLGFCLGSVCYCMGSSRFVLLFYLLPAYCLGYSKVLFGICLVLLSPAWVLFGFAWVLLSAARFRSGLYFVSV